MKKATKEMYFLKDAQKKLREMPACIRSAAPGATEGIKWGMPAFSYKKILVMFGGFKHHIGFYPTPGPITAFEKELSKFKTATGSIQFALDKPLPLGLIRKITVFRAIESEEKGKKWRSYDASAGCSTVQDYSLVRSNHGKIVSDFAILDPA